MLSLTVLSVFSPSSFLPGCPTYDIANVGVYCKLISIVCILSVVILDACSSVVLSCMLAHGSPDNVHDIHTGHTCP